MQGGRKSLNEGRLVYARISRERWASEKVSDVGMKKNEGQPAATPRQRPRKKRNDGSTR